MISTDDLSLLPGRTMHGVNGDKIGKIVDVYESTDGAEGTFVTVATGLFGTGASFVPLTEAQLRGDDVAVPYSKSQVKDAPRVDTDEELSSQEEERLYEHYGIGVASHSAGVAGTTHREGDVGTPADRYDGRAVGEDAAMTRSEERLHVGTQRVESGRARLRKRIVTETETRTVPVSHDEVRIEREPISGGVVSAAFDGPALSEQEHEIVLTRETPVVSKETVAVERVRLGAETVTEQTTVSEQVRKENIELVEDGTTDRDRTSDRDR